MASLIEIMQLCRLCLVKDQVNIPIFEEQGDIRQIFLKISACLPVKVSREDNLPKKICDTCSSKLESLYQFWNTSANSEKQLLKWLSQVGVEKTSGRVAQSHSINSDGVVLKQEVVELADTHSVDDDLAPDDLNISNDAHDYILQQQQLPYQPLGFQFQQDGFTEGEGTSSTSGPSATVTSEAADAPKRKRRAAAMKALPAHIDSEEEDEDDVDMVETKIAKTEEQTDESGAEDPEPTAFVGVPSTSADNEQPGPSGVGKGAAEATLTEQKPMHHSSLQVDTTIPYLDFITHQNMIPPNLNYPFAAPFTQQNSIAIPNFMQNVISDPQFNSVPNQNVDFIMTPQDFVHFNVSSTSDNGFPQLDTDIKPKYLNISEEASNASLISSENQDESYKHKCEHCGKKFKFNSYLNTHLKTHLRKEKKVDQKYECSVCKAVFANRRTYKYHEHMHLDVKSYLCEICKKPFKNRHTMKQHMRLHTNEHAYKCGLCSSTFRRLIGLKQHSIELHNENSKHVCEICNKGFAYASDLKRHINHTHKKIFPCDICNTNCTSFYMSQKHQLAHKGISKSKNYVCKICERAFEYPNYLKQHMRGVHEGIRKQFICDICGKAISSAKVLESHKLRHKGIRPFQCNNCRKMFYTDKELKLHTITHTGEKPFSCKICEKKFTKKSTLNIHMRLHTGEKPFKCNLCKKAFVSRTLLNSHKKNKHLIT